MNGIWLRVKHFSLIRIYLKLLLYYFLLFFALRLVFLFSNYNLLKLKFSEVYMPFYKALYMDFSTYSYMSILALLFAVVHVFTQREGARNINIAVHIALSLIVGLLFVADAFLYTEWNTKISFQALEHLANPMEIVNITPWWMLITAVAILVAIIYFSIKCLRNIFVFSKRNIFVELVSFVFLLAVSILGIRGGWQPIPIQEGDIAFSKNIAVNDMAVNTVWYIGHILFDKKMIEQENAFNFFETTQAQKIIDTSYVSNGNFNIPQILKTDKPNIVFIVLESFNANCSNYFGTGNYMPFIDSLARNGFCFSNCYSSGHLSDQGIPAIFSALPALPSISLINQPRKSKNLPCINQEFENYNYETGFFYGGQLSYGNIKNYLIQKQFDIVKDEKDFVGDYRKQRLGICDEDMAMLFLDQINKAHPPFFYNWFTISSHMPYDIPIKMKNIVETENKYVNTILYTDNSLRNFFARAKDNKWFNNTLFVLVGDHSHNDFANYELDNHKRNKIPLVFFGDVIKEEFRGRKYEHTVSQLDIATTILQMFILPSCKFMYSKNLFDTTNRAVVYSFFHGTGCVSNDSNFVVIYKKNAKAVRCKFTNLDSAKITNYLKAYTQLNYQNYIRD